MTRRHNKPLASKSDPSRNSQNDKHRSAGNKTEFLHTLRRRHDQGMAVIDRVVASSFADMVNEAVIQPNRIPL